MSIRDYISEVVAIAGIFVKVSADILQSMTAEGGHRQAPPFKGGEPVTFAIINV